jgi:hypothetical protein
MLMMVRRCCSSHCRFFGSLISGSALTGPLTCSRMSVIRRGCPSCAVVSSRVTTRMRKTVRFVDDHDYGPGPATARGVIGLVVVHSGARVEEWRASPAAVATSLMALPVVSRTTLNVMPDSIPQSRSSVGRCVAVSWHMRMLGSSRESS